MRSRKGLLLFILALIVSTSNTLNSQERHSVGKDDTAAIKIDSNQKDDRYVPDKPWLTREENEWLRKNNKIRVSGPVAFPPFHYFDEKGNQLGIASGYIDLLQKRLGIEVEIIWDVTWSEILENTKTGEIDLIALAAKSADREQFLNFSEPYLSFPMIIVTQTDAPFIGGLEDLHNKRVAFIKNVVTAEWVSENNIKPIPVNVNTPLEALQAVSTGKADAYIGNLAATSYLIWDKGLVNLKIAAPTSFGNYNLYFAGRSDWPELISIINKTLQTVSPEEHSSIRDQWLSPIRYEFGIRTRDIIKWVLGVVFVAALLLFVTLYWNRKLQAEIQIRRKTETDLKEALKNVNNLEGLLPICANCKKIRDDQGDWNQLEAYIEHHSEANFSHGICPDCAKELYSGTRWYKKKDLSTGA